MDKRVIVEKGPGCQLSRKATKKCSPRGDTKPCSPQR